MFLTLRIVWTFFHPKPRSIQIKLKVKTEYDRTTEYLVKCRDSETSLKYILQLFWSVEWFTKITDLYYILCYQPYYRVCKLFTIIKKDESCI